MNWRLVLDPPPSKRQPLYPISPQYPELEPNSNIEDCGDIGVRGTVSKQAANCPPTSRRWRVQTPDGRTWDVTRTPPATDAEVAQAWPEGSVLDPLPDDPTEGPGHPLPGHSEDAIRAWLRHIGEHDPGITSEVIDRCRRDPGALAYFIQRAYEVPDSQPLAYCVDCIHEQASKHPHLLRCQAGMVSNNPTQRFWDTDFRDGDRWEVRP